MLINVYHSIPILLFRRKLFLYIQIYIYLFCFSQSLCQDNVTGLLVGDGAHLVLDAKGTAGVEEVTRAFLSSPGIEPTLVPAGWVSNHYRWLVWKFASVERSFPQQFAARYET